MSTFTTPLKKVIEYTGGTVEVVPMTYKGIDMGAISKVSGGKVGFEQTPIFDPAYRDILNGKIVDHYWNREIGFETIDLFQMKMRSHLNNVMTLYNKLYLSEQIPYEALNTINLRTVTAAENQGTEGSVSTSDTTSTTDNNSRAVNSSTPQTMLAGNEDYASGAVDSTGKSESVGANTSTGDSVSTANAESDSLVSGYQGSASDLIMRYRDSLLNIDLMVIRDIDELFMQVFDNGDSYTHGGTFQNVYY